MSTLLYFLLSHQQYSYIILGCIIYIAAAGAPISGNLLLLGAGAFAVAGNFNMELLFVIALVASVLGDNTGYLVGRTLGTRVLQYLVHAKRRQSTILLITRSRQYFHTHGALAIFITRWLINVLGGTLNIIAGAELYPFRKFLLWDILGEVLGVSIPLLLGYTFSVTWELIGTITGYISLLCLLLLILVGLGWLARRLLHSPLKREEENVYAMKDVVPELE